MIKRELEKLAEHVQRIVESQERTEKDIIKIQKDLEYHIKRTDFLERIQVLIIGIMGTAVLGGLLKLLIF